MNDLTQINGELLSIPDVRIWGGSNIQGDKLNPTRTSLIIQCEHGAVELYEEPYKPITEGMKYTTHLGAVLWHSPKDILAFNGYLMKDCSVTGGDCYSDGSALHYDKQFYNSIRKGHWLQVLTDLASFHSSWIGCSHCKDYA